MVPGEPVEVEIDVPGAINGANRGRTSLQIEIEVEGDGMEDGMQVEIADDLRCGGNVSDVMVAPERINEGDDEDELVALFRTSDLELICADTKIVCKGTANGTEFTAMDGTWINRGFERNRCPQTDEDDHDDD